MEYRQGVGEPLSSHDRKELAAYWKLEEYPFRSQMVLSYEDSYHQIELMKQYSTAYSMTFFQPSARIVYCYEKDKDQFSEEEKEAESAKSIHFRSIISTFYYSSDGKLLLKLEKSGKNQFEITAYSAEDTPQLLNSTLLKVPEDQNAEGQDRDKDRSYIQSRRSAGDAQAESRGI